MRCITTLHHKQLMRHSISTEACIVNCTRTILPMHATRLVTPKHSSLRREQMCCCHTRKTKVDLKAFVFDFTHFVAKFKKPEADAERDGDEKEKVCILVYYTLLAFSWNNRLLNRCHLIHRIRLLKLFCLLFVWDADCTHSTTTTLGCVPKGRGSTSAARCCGCRTHTRPCMVIAGW
jgi:hypothetical protein